MTTITTESQTKATNQSYSQNGIIFERCLSKFSTAKEALADFGDSLLEAIEHQIWLGFLHPQNASFCSFIAKDGEGNIDHQVSFKLWLASSPAQGGLGISDLNQIEILCKSNPKCLNAVLPLLTDGESIRKANCVLESQGLPPLVRFSKQKEYLIRKMIEAPDPIRYFIQEYSLGQKISAKLSLAYSRLEEKHKKEVDKQLAKWKANPPAWTKRDWEYNLCKEIGLNYFTPIVLRADAPEAMAQKIIEALPNKDDIKKLIAQLQAQLRQG